MGGVDVRVERADALHVLGRAQAPFADGVVHLIGSLSHVGVDGVSSCLARELMPRVSSVVLTMIWRKESQAFTRG